MIKPPLEQPLPLGTKIPHYGEIVAIRSEGGDFGERYYFLKDRHGTISFMPASSIEEMWKQKEGVGRSELASQRIQ